MRERDSRVTTGVRDEKRHGIKNLNSIFFHTRRKMLEKTRAVIYTV